MIQVQVPPPRVGQRYKAKKYDDLLKKRKYKGEEVEKRGKGEIFTVLGEKLKFLKKGGGKNILFWSNIQHL